MIHIMSYWLKSFHAYLFNFVSEAFIESAYHAVHIGDLRDKLLLVKIVLCNRFCIICKSFVEIAYHAVHIRDPRESTRRSSNHINYDINGLLTLSIGNKHHTCYSYILLIL